MSTETNNSVTSPAWVDRFSNWWHGTTKLEKVWQLVKLFFVSVWRHKRASAILFLILFIPAWLVNRGGWEVSNGKDAGRVGKISKFSKKGSMPFGLFHTWEGELTVGEEGASIRWEFSCPDEDLVPQMKQALDTQSTVRLRYTQRKYKIWWQGDTDYWITGVEVAHSTKNNNKGSGLQD